MRQLSALLFFLIGCFTVVLFGSTNDAKNIAINKNDKIYTNAENFYNSTTERIISQNDRDSLIYWLNEYPKHQISFEADYYFLVSNGYEIEAQKAKNVVSCITQNTKKIKKQLVLDLHKTHKIWQQ